MFEIWSTRVQANKSGTLSTKDGEEAVNEDCSTYSFLNPKLYSNYIHLKRQEAVDAACDVWNAVDKSSKRMIPRIVAVPAISHEGSDAGYRGSDPESE